MSDNKDLRSADRIGLLNEKQSIILNYIDNKIDSVGYIKAKEIAKQVNELSSKEVGTNMPRIARESEEFRITEWSTSAGNTWRIERI
jgi:ADP-dependent phosphofructokinase/glucokinase